MLLAGDEFGRTQGGNNNAYCQDDEISWLNWNIEEKGQSLTRFVQRLTRLRHKYPIFRRNLFLTGRYNEELDVKDLTWINANGGEMEESHWNDAGMRCFGMLMDGRAQTTGVRQRGKEATMLLVINGHHEMVDFTLPECPGGRSWTRLIDTNIPDDSEHGGFETGQKYGVTARSVLLFVLEPET
jgi:glycogen operon protein